MVAKEIDFYEIEYFEGSSNLPFIMQTIYKNFKNRVVGSSSCIQQATRGGLCALRTSVIWMCELAAFVFCIC